MTARKRVTSASLARLFEAVDRPIYVLDDRARIVYCNRACLEWVELDRDDLLGRQCSYCSLPAGADVEPTGGRSAVDESEELAASTPGAAAERRKAHCSRPQGTTGSASRAEEVAGGLCPSPAVFGGSAHRGMVACRSSEGTLRRRRAEFVRLADAEGKPIGVIALVDRVDLADEEPEPAVTANEVSPVPAGLSEAEKLHELLRQFQQEAATRWGLDRLVGTSAAARLARRQVQLAAGSRESVLITGPPGSGRQRIAYTIHFNSPRAAQGPLVPLACSVLGPELIGSTVAAIASTGRNHAEEPVGTLLLNQVDRLPPQVQRELAGLLGGGEFPARLIATAEHPLVELAQAGRYDDRLAAALSTLVVRLPALAERREDVPLLAQAFLEQLNVQGRKQLAGFTSEALDALYAYHWPGNVDELYRFVVAACKRAAGPYVTAEDLPERIHLVADAASHVPVEEPIELDRFLAQVERELVVRALRLARGNKARAARLLGLSRPRLYRRMVQLGLDRPQSDSSRKKPDHERPGSAD